jgi:hypothetical protein
MLRGPLAELRDVAEHVQHQAVLFGALELRPGAFSQWLLALVRLMISAGSPRSISNRAKASKGEVVSTPPKSQITAAIITSHQY